jgi:predicted histone-like DNA-binding protein
MAVFLAVRQDKRKTSNNLWYGRTYCPNIIDTHELAKRIEANVSVKESDVYAVLIEMADVMAYEIANSNKIHLERLGYFYPSVRSTGSGTKDDWSIAENIKSGRVRFTPEYTRSAEMASTGKASGLSSRAISGVGFDYKVVDLAERVKPQP